MARVYENLELNDNTITKDGVNLLETSGSSSGEASLLFGNLVSGSITSGLRLFKVIPDFIIDTSKEYEIVISGTIRSNIITSSIIRLDGVDLIDTANLIPDMFNDVSDSEFNTLIPMVLNTAFNPSLLPRYDELKINIGSTGSNELGIMFPNLTDVRLDYEIRSR